VPRREDDPPAPATPPADAGRWTAGRVALLVIGTIVGLIALAVLVGGCALVVVDQTQRDDDGFVMSPDEELATPTYAIVSENADLEDEGAEQAIDTLFGTVRIRSESEGPVFVGIARADDVAGYLDGVEHDVISDLDAEGDPDYTRRPGAGTPGPPGDEAFWIESTAGAGERVVEWNPEEGDWRVVVMNADASRGVSAEMSIGAELDWALWIGLGLLVVGALLAAAAVLAGRAATRGRHRAVDQTA
jgi:hypothetical protein